MGDTGLIGAVSGSASGPVAGPALPLAARRQCVERSAEVQGSRLTADHVAERAVPAAADMESAGGAVWAVVHRDHVMARAASAPAEPKTAEARALRCQGFRPGRSQRTNTLSAVAKFCR